MRAHADLVARVELVVRLRALLLPMIPQLVAQEGGTAVMPVLLLRRLAAKLTSPKPALSAEGSRL